MKKGERTAFGRVMTPAFPKRCPLAGTMDQVRPNCAQWPSNDHAFVDWSAYPLSTPSGGGLAPTPDRSESPATGQRKKRVDSRSLRVSGSQAARISRPARRPFWEMFVACR